MPPKLLAIGAHPDDVEFGCAAILINEIRRGGVVKIWVLSKGEAGSNGTPEIREAEARRAAELIGAEVEFADFGGDCHIEYTPANTIRVAREIRSFRPDIVLAPHTSEDQHPDHARVGKLVRDAARLARYRGLQELQTQPAHAIANLYYYAVTREFGMRPDLIIDISEARDLWEQAMRCHESQAKSKQYVEMRLAATRSLGHQAGVEYAMSLYLNDPVLLEHISSLTLSSRNYGSLGQGGSRP
jgi:bacillithiol biosynthesis deacetylase BshB1